ncbi:hypothetical protein [Agromyces lapidis]|uniref:Uncharacterized protein n=1 Tax=Agromyces lapidis TaxID=279574 RepID=A0ABV5SL87_9MICO|nr:hypothetical protein [Agromyces lapidis]
MADALGVPGLIMGGAIALFALAIVIGMIVRVVRAPRGQRMRAAFGPLAGAGETYQELHTGQRGLQDSIIESIQEQEHGGHPTNDRKRTI